ncbi:hypothetical protein ACKZDW_07930 [Ralstonia syzygii subsp. celebesensis]
MAKGNSTKAAQDAAPKATDTAQAPAATTDETTANAGEVVQTGAEGAQDNAPATPAADESAAQPNPNEGNQPPAAPPAQETPLPESVTMAAPTASSTKRPTNTTSGRPGRWSPTPLTSSCWSSDKPRWSKPPC